MTGKNPKITKVQTTNPQPDGAINRGRPKTYVKHVQPHPTHTMNQKDDAISHWNSTTPPPAHTQKERPPHSAQNKGRQTHPRNKSTLAHYRVLKQHQHTHQPDHHCPASQAASLQATHNINQKSNSRSTTVYPLVVAGVLLLVGVVMQAAYLGGYMNPKQALKNT